MMVATDSLEHDVDGAIGSVRSGGSVPGLCAARGWAFASLAVGAVICEQTNKDESTVVRVLLVSPGTGNGTRLSIFRFSKSQQSQHFFRSCMRKEFLG